MGTHLRSDSSESNKDWDRHELALRALVCLNHDLITVEKLFRNCKEKGGIIFQNSKRRDGDFNEVAGNLLNKSLNQIRPLIFTANLYFEGWTCV